MTPSDPIPTRRRALFDAIRGLDPVGLASVELHVRHLLKIDAGWPGASVGSDFGDEDGMGSEVGESGAVPSCGAVQTHAGTCQGRGAAVETVADAGVVARSAHLSAGTSS